MYSSKKKLRLETACLRKESSSFWIFFSLLSFLVRHKKKNLNPRSEKLFCHWSGPTRFIHNLKPILGFMHIYIPPGRDFAQDCKWIINFFVFFFLHLKPHKILTQASEKCLPFFLFWAASTLIIQHFYFVNPIQKPPIKKILKMQLSKNTMLYFEQHLVQNNIITSDFFFRAKICLRGFFLSLYVCGCAYFSVSSIKKNNKKNIVPIENIIVFSFFM